MKLREVEGRAELRSPATMHSSFFTVISFDCSSTSASCSDRNGLPCEWRQEKEILR